MIRHLSRKHHIERPINLSQGTLTTFCTTGVAERVSFLIFLIISCGLGLTSIQQLLPLNRANLNDRIIRLLINKELPISLVDSPEFRSCLEIVNPSSVALLSKRTAISEGILSQFLAMRNQIIATLSSVEQISITCDAWTSPTNTAFLGVTAHWVQDFEMKELILALKPIDGPHTGINIAVLLKSILDSFHISDRLYCITADNASNNMTMGRHLHSLIPHFNPDHSLHGCVAHVINLVAKAGLAVFEKRTPPNPISAVDPTLADHNPQTATDSRSILNTIEPTPHEEIHSVLARIRSFHKKVRYSSQIKQLLDNAIAGAHDLSRKVGLVHEVSTRWSSTHNSLERFFELKRVIKYHCDGNPVLSEFNLTEKEWDLVGNIVQFLRPLAVVIKSIEGSKYPTFSEAMPDYQWIVRRLEAVSSFFFSL